MLKKLLFYQNPEEVAPLKRMPASRMIWSGSDHSTTTFSLTAVLRRYTSRLPGNICR